MKPRRGDIVHILWRDIEHLSDWRPIDDRSGRAKPDRYEAVGWLVRRGRRRTTIVATVAYGKGHCNASCRYSFPNGAIVRTTVLLRP